MMSFDARKKGLELSLEADPSLPVYRPEHFIIRNIYSDPNRFRQILINLIGNSLKFTTKGSISVRLLPESTEFLRCLVTDTGVGISEDLCKRLFAPYVRGYDPRGINKGGAGFGLSISKRLCEKLGGNIGVSSTVGVGSTFSFSIRTNLPLASTCCPPNAAPEERSVRELSPRPTTSNGSIMTSHLAASPADRVKEEEQKERRPRCVQALAVDDSSLNRCVLMGLMRRLNVQCDEVLSVLDIPRIGL